MFTVDAAHYSGTVTAVMMGCVSVREYVRVMHDRMQFINPAVGNTLFSFHVRIACLSRRFSLSRVRRCSE
ncbi:hypothetical protein J6590_001931 [Homalodisca vitripennis]|nr:hypothetical protein J6590_001931 [Homalodisca vitripennis]